MVDVILGVVLHVALFDALEVVLCVMPGVTLDVAIGVTMGVTLCVARRITMGVPYHMSCQKSSHRRCSGYFLWLSLRVQILVLLWYY